MKAAVYDTIGGPEVFQYLDVDAPVVKPNEVLIRNEVISVEGGDLVTRSRNVPPHPHFIVGYSSAGEVVEVGEEVTDIKVGDKVTAFSPAGSHAELRAVRANRCWVLPQGMDLKAAACIPVGLGTAYQALFDLGGLKAGDDVLVVGAAGGVGVAAVQFAHQAGARVIGTASRDDQLSQLKALGMDEGINHSSEDVVARVKELTGGRGVQLAIDPVGGEVLQMACKCLATAGKAVMVGMVEDVPHTIDAKRLMVKRQSLIGCLLGMVMHQPREREFISEIIDQVHRGQVSVPIDKEFPLSEAEACHRYAESRGRPMGRVLLIP